MHNGTGLFFWGFLVVYGIVMFAISPKAVTIGGFFKGTDKKGRAASSLMVTSSVFIAWIFAKSVYNCANMGYSYGIVGGIGYAVYWLCIPLTGFAIYRLRRKVHDRFSHKQLRCSSGILLQRSDSGSFVQRGMVQHLGHWRILR